MKAIEIENLCMDYKSNWSFQKTRVLHDLCLTVEEGQLFGYLGANGSGKTTTIKILMSLLHPASGNARLCGLEITNAQSRLEVGFLPENPYFYEYLTPLESLRFYGGLQNVSRKEIQSRGIKLLERVGLEHTLKMRLGEFSKGMRQRFGFCQALINEPKLLILDEPMSGLDPMGRKMIKTLILEQRKYGRTVFFSSHILSDVEEICDHIAILVKGKLRSQGEVQKLIQSETKRYEFHLEKVSSDLQEILGEKALKFHKREDSVFCTLPVENKEELGAWLKRFQDKGVFIEALIPEKETLEEYFVRLSSASS